MFFVLSKILLIFLFPFWWVMLLLIWMLLSRSAITKKRLKIIIIVLLIVFTNPFLYRYAVEKWQPRPATLPPGKVYEAGILLGGLSGYDRFKKGYFGEDADRFIQTVNLYHRKVIKKIVIAGGSGKLAQDEPAEAFFLKEQMIYNGIPAPDIIMETRSRNTYENAVFCKKIIDSLKINSPYILITSAMHMRRALQVFEKAGYPQITPYPCAYTVVPSDLSFDKTILPNIALLNLWGNLLKEMVGLAVYRMTGKA